MSAWDLADSEAAAGLLRCWVRETGVVLADSPMRLDLSVSGTSVLADLLHNSPTGLHQFAATRFLCGGAVPATALAALLGAELAGARHCAAGVSDLVARVADSTARTAAHLARREPTPVTPFLAAEQALLLGHPLHPTPKSRPGLTDRELTAYSPELGGSFPLHWFAAASEVVQGDSAYATSAPKILATLEAPPVPAGFVAVPAHPWQARDVLGRPVVQELLAAGLLDDLGPAGPSWWPTSSLRTVYRPDSGVMLKFSLGLSITNSRRNQLADELRRGIEVHRMLEAGLGTELHRRFPRFDMVRDPAWLAVGRAGLAELSGLEVVIRDNPFPGPQRVECVAGLVARHPATDEPPSRLAGIVRRLAVATGRSTAEVSREWFRRYFTEVIEPVLWLYHRHGLGLEAHQQNTLVVLDVDGWPIGGRYRDNQGYYFSAERSGRLERWLPGAGSDLGTHCSDAVIDERLGYYVGINNVLGVIGALGSQGLAEENRLLTDLRALLLEVDGALAARLAHEPVLRCKANLLTRLDGLDELVGPLEAQSVYVDIPNPIRGAS